jgi:osmoprotectant transport system ATP-binding protein
MQGVEKRFGGRAVVSELNLEIEAGETFVLIGPSGCGKTTTLRMLNRLIEPSAGRIEVLGEDVARADPTALRRRIGYVIQEGGLFPHYSVQKNVAVVPELAGWDSARIAKRCTELLELLGLDPRDYAERFPHELSGGQRQRVGIARALAADPPLVLLDEPFGALDPITRESVQDEFRALCKQLGKTFVLVTHDVFEAVRLADRIGVMAEGRLVQVATPAELVRRPATELVTALLGRHRFQLRLMTARLGAAVAALAGEPPPPDGTPTIDAAPGESVWNALDRMENAGSEHVRIGARVVSRHALLDKAGSA